MTITTPLLLSTSPSANEMDVAADADIVLIFNEPVMAGVGTIGLYGSWDNKPIPVTDTSSVSFSGNTVTIHPGGLMWGDGYTVSLPVGLFQDASGNAFDGASFGFDTADPFPSGGITVVSGSLATPSLLGNDVPIDMTAWDATQLQNGTITSISDARVDIRGATDGLTYRITGGGFLTTATSYTDIEGSRGELAVFDDRSGIHHFLYAIDFGSLIQLDVPDASYAATIFGGGYDSLIGSSAGDVLEGFGGNDTIDGGAGADLLTGGTGVDTFVVSRVPDLVPDDEITDFEIGDKIDLSAIAGLHFIGSAAFSGVAGQVNYVWSGNTTTLQIDSDGDGSADAFLKLDGGNFILGETGAGSEVIHIIAGFPPPSLVSSTPADNATDVDVSLTTALVFDQNMELGSGAVELRRSSDGSLVEAFNVDDYRSVQVSGRTVTLHLSYYSPPLADSTGYYITVAPGALKNVLGEDFAGISDPTILNFTTGDTGPPKLVSATPAPNAHDVPVDSNIVLNFSEPVVAGSGTIDFYNGSTGQILQSIAVDDTSQVAFSGNQIVINPAFQLAWSQGYNITVSPGTILDLSGNSFAGFSVDYFSTAPPPDTTPPLTTYVSPYDGSFGVNAAINYIALTFNEAVQAGTGFVEIRHASDGSLFQRIDIADTTHVHFHSGGGYVEIDLPSHYEFSTKYSVTMDPGAIEDLAGNPFAGYSAAAPLTFTTASAQGSSAILLSSSPSDDALGVLPWADIVLTFNRDVIAGQGNIVIHNWSDGSVAATIAVTDASQVHFAGNIVTIDPAEDLAYNTAYYLTMPYGVISDNIGPIFSGIYSTTDLNFVTGAPTPIEAKGATTLAAAGSHFDLLDNNAGGPSLKYSGGDVWAGEFAAWTPIGVEKTGSGYEIAWKFSGTDQYTLWSTDANGNYIANLIGAVAGSNPTLLSAETLFQQDLNGDGQIGLPTTPIETKGATTLASVGDHFDLLDNSGSGPSLKFAGGDVVGGQFGAWTPIGAEKTASGYEIAWNVSGSDLYTLWSTDANGNYIANLIGGVPGSNALLMSSETLFQQDLNGDGQIGLGTTISIETTGTTTLVGVGNRFSLLDSNGTGPSLKYSGGDVMAGQFGSWTPIGAEKTASGYEIAWKVPGADQYTLWSTDANGNYIANIVAAVSESNSTLMSAENLFQQDLNGDGQIGLPTTLIESKSATTLAAVGNHFSLLDNNGTGPSLKYSGGDVAAGQFGSWTPIGAEHTASGYEIAWKVPGADQYTLWNTDANGNYIANIVAAVSGSNSTLMSVESLFQQDLNGDGHIGLGTPTMVGMSSIDIADQATVALADVHPDWLL